MVDCMECTNFIKCHYSGQLTGRLTSCPDFKQKPKTNADRIRAMSDEELANIMAGTPICKERYMDCLKDGCDCEQCLLEWLKQPAEGD